MVSKEKHCQKMAEEKRSKTFDKVVESLVELIDKKEQISLKIVIEKSGVSQAWFYNNPNLKQLIHHLENASLDTINYLKILENKLENMENLIKGNLD